MSEPKYIWLYWPVRGFSVEPYMRTHPIGDSGEFRYTLTSGQEWDELMELARLAYMKASNPSDLNMFDARDLIGTYHVLKNLLAYLEGK